MRGNCLFARGITLVIAAIFGAMTIIEPVTSFAETEGASEEPGSTDVVQSLEAEDDFDDEADVVSDSGDISALNAAAETLEITGWKRKSSTSMKLIWDCDTEDFAGYQIQYSKYANYKSPKSITVDDPTIHSKVITGLEKNRKYYVRIRAYIVTSAKATEYSDWEKYTTVLKDRTLSISMLKKSGKTYELRSAASETTEGYAMLEGGCTDGTYSYFVLINKDNSKGRILKSRRSDNATVAVSKVMVLDHANDMTYNEKTGELLVVHYNNSPYRITVIDPETLTIDENVDVEIPDELEGASENNLDNIKGFSAIGYSSARNQYVLRLKKSYNYLILDSNFTPVKYVTTTVRGENVNQGIDADDDYIYDVQSKSGYYNTVMVYDWDGEYQATVKVPSKYEMENLYHVGNKFYAGVYRYYYTTYYTTHYKTYKVKWKKVKGKWKYKTKYKTKTKKVRVTYKVAHKRLVREDYVYSIGTI